MKSQIDFSDAKFRKASFSNGGSGGSTSHCVMIAVKDGHIGIRNSKDVNKATLSFTMKEWDAFVKGVKHGEFDF